MFTREKGRKVTGNNRKQKKYFGSDCPHSTREKYQN